MKHDETSAQAASQYAAAYAAHYQMNDLSEALSLYRAIMTTHPRSQEAKYSYAQIQSIVRAVVPEQTIFEALIDLVVARLKE